MRVNDRIRMYLLMFVQGMVRHRFYVFFGKTWELVLGGNGVMWHNFRGNTIDILQLFLLGAYTLPCVFQTCVLWVQNHPRYPTVVV